MKKKIMCFMLMALLFGGVYSFSEDSKAYSYSLNYTGSPTAGNSYATATLSWHNTEGRCTIYAYSNISDVVAGVSIGGDYKYKNADVVKKGYSIYASKDVGYKGSVLKGTASFSK